MSTNQESQNETTTSSRSGGNPKNPQTDPTSEKVPPAETETTKISSVSPTAAATNKPETDPNFEKIPPAEISPVSQSTAVNNKPETDPNSEKIPPAETETTKISSVSQTTAATNKPETDPNSEKTPPVEKETTESSSISQTAAATNKPETDPNSEKIPPPEISPVSQTTAATNKPETDPNSEKTPPAELSPVSQTTAATNRPETDPNSEKIPPAEISPVSPTTAATNKPETDGSKALKQYSESDPNATSTPRDKTETPSRNSPPETRPINNSRTEDSEALKEGSAIDAEDQTTSENTFPTKNDHTTTNDQQTDGTKATSPDSAAGADRHIQEITPVENETASAPSSPPKNGSSEVPTITNQYKRDSAADAGRGRQKSLSWNLICKKFTKILPFGKPKTSQSTAANQGTEEKKLPKSVQEDWDHVRKDLEYIAICVKELRDEKLESLYTKALEYYELLAAKGNQKKEDIHELRNDLMKLKLEVPIKHKLAAEKNQRRKELQFGYKAKLRNDEEVLKMVPKLHHADVFERSMEFRDFEARYQGLDDRLKLCLLCFSVFSENAIIKKRLMVQWWVAEGIASEDEANKCFTQLIEKGFTEPENKNRSRSVGSCRMHPFDRSALVTLAERAKFFNFDERGEPTQNFSGSFQACLVGAGLISYEDLKGAKLRLNELEKLHFLFNVDEQVLDFKLNWFSKMKNLNFLYLGRWKVSAKDHIEVEDTEFLKGLESMSCLKFLSLQGVSNIIALPESILKLVSLKFLDLRACYNLETIPDRTGTFLKNLTHLDMSECYLLAHMPKSLSSLSDLKVLKGFVVGKQEKNTCTLHDLQKLEKLIKLCIYTDLNGFPDKKDVTDLGNLKKLKKLTITWGGGTLRGEKQPGKPSDNGNKKDNPTAENTKVAKKQERQGSSESHNDSASTGKLPKGLEKLDLKCFPKSITPDWLTPHNFENRKLEKLYIRGGTFSDLGQNQDIDDCSLDKQGKKITWKVKELRLKYLSEIEMEWRQLQDLFPDLDYLEQVNCPKLTLFPCDANGVWIKSKTSSDDSL